MYMLNHLTLTQVDEINGKSLIIVLKCGICTISTVGKNKRINIIIQDDFFIPKFFFIKIVQYKIIKAGKILILYSNSCKYT